MNLMTALSLSILMTAAVIEATYLGCWIDRSQRALSGHFKDLGRSNTVHACKQLCRSKGFKYAGTQYTTQCFCGNDYDKYGKVADSQCNKKCPGEQQQSCGGTWRNAVYAVDYVDDSIYLGCWKDASSRALSGHFQTLGSANSVEACRSLCQSKAYKYSGNQYSTQCFCGDDYKQYGRMPEADCRATCPANSKQSCGGTWRNSVYATNYLGCWRDSPTRDLGYFRQMSHSQASVETCIGICKGQGYKYAGVQYSTQCFCGNTYKSYGEVPRSECSATCRGNSNQKCGGTWRNSVYRTGMDGQGNE